jgi:hypothetical protein
MGGNFFWVLSFSFLFLLCTAHAASPTGWFDGVKNTSIPSVGGWACDADNYSRSLNIHLYLDGPYPSGTFLGATVANLSGESAIGTYCGGTTSHRFVYNIPQLDYGVGRDYKIYAYALEYPPSVNNSLLGGSPAELKSKPLIGAIRWDFWFTSSLALRLLASDTRWHYRIPLTTNISLNGTSYVPVGGVDTQEKMDYEIEAAKRGGIDYWAMLYYNPERTWPEAPQHPDMVNAIKALNLYHNSSKNDQVKLSLIVSAGWLRNLSSGGKPHWENWEKTSSEFVEYFKKDNYQKVQGNRPLVFFFDMYSFELTWDACKFNESPVQTIRRKTLDEGLGEPYFVLLDFFADSTALYGQRYGFDAVSSYGNPLGSDGIAHPYQRCVDSNMWYREGIKPTAHSLGTKIIPPINTGWDPRTMIENNAFTREPLGYVNRTGSTPDYCVNAQPSEIASNLGQTIDWLENSSNSEYVDYFKSVLIYAWNEHAEGGWLAPTHGDNYTRLDAIKSMIVTKASTYGYITVTSTSTTTTTTTTTTTSTTSSTTTMTSSTTTTSSTTSTTTTTSGSSTTSTTTMPCSLAGDYLPCGEITLSEIVDAINQWANGALSLSDVIDLINAWADPASYPSN